MNTELELELTWLFEERSEDPCEHSEHATRPWAHAGTGEWLIQSKGKVCGHGNTRPFLVCDKYKTEVVDPQRLTRCTTCSVVISTPYTVLGRKGVDF